MKILLISTAVFLALSLSCSQTKTSDQGDPSAEFSEEDIKLFDEGGFDLDGNNADELSLHKRARLTRAERRERRCNRRISFYDRVFGQEVLCGFLLAHPRLLKRGKCKDHLVAYCVVEEEPDETPDTGGSDGSSQDGGSGGDGQDGGSGGDGSGGGTGGF